MRVIGVDPGLNGGIAVLSGEGAIIDLIQMPLYPGRPKRIDWMRCLTVPHAMWSVWGGPIVFASERLHPMPAKMGGGAANFSRGASTAWHVMALTLQKACPRTSDQRSQILWVLPQRWQRMLDGLPGSDTKQRAISAVQRFWPRDVERFIPKKTKYHDGLVDAALIAEWARRQTDIE